MLDLFSSSDSRYLYYIVEYKIGISIFFFFIYNPLQVVRQTDDGVGSTTINQKPKKNSKLERSATLATCYLKAKPPSPSSPPPVSLLTSIEMSRPERERAIHMTPRSTENIFSDVTGFDIAPPRLFGMTLDQRREFLRSNSDNYCIVDED